MEAFPVQAKVRNRFFGHSSTQPLSSRNSERRGYLSPKSPSRAVRCKPHRRLQGCLAGPHWPCNRGGAFAGGPVCHALVAAVASSARRAVARTEGAQLAAPTDAVAAHARRQPALELFGTTPVFTAAPRLRARRAMIDHRKVRGRPPRSRRLSGPNSAAIAITMMAGSGTTCRWLTTSCSG